MLLSLTGPLSAPRPLLKQSLHFETRSTFLKQGPLFGKRGLISEYESAPFLEPRLASSGSALVQTLPREAVPRRARM